MLSECLFFHSSVKISVNTNISIENSIQKHIVQSFQRSKVEFFVKEFNLNVWVSEINIRRHVFTDMNVTAKQKLRFDDKDNNKNNKRTYILRTEHTFHL